MNFTSRLLLVLVLLIQQSSAQQKTTQLISTRAQDSIAIYDKTLSPTAMQKDLQLFRRIREKVNSGLYRYRNQHSIDSIYRWAFAQTKKPRRTSDFYKIILILTDFEGSVHNYTELDQPYLAFLRRSKSFFPYALKYIEGRIIFNNDIPGITVGSRIHSINGIGDTTLMKSFYKYMPADGFTITEKLSGSVNASFGIRYLIEYGLTDSFTVSYSAPGSQHIKIVSFPAVSLAEREQNLTLRHSAPVDNIIDFKQQPSHSFTMLDSFTGLLNFRIFSMATGVEDPAFPVYIRWIDSVFQVLHKNNVRNLVIDIRNNPGGSDPTFEQPMMYLTDHPFRENTLAYTIFDEVPYESFFYGVSTDHKMGAQEIIEGKKFLKSYFPKLINRKNLQNQKYNPVYQPKNPAFKGNLYLLVDEGVASAASHFASLVKGYARKVIIVGVETCGGYYGHNGHTPIVYQLPNSKIKTKFSIVYVVQDAPGKPDQPEGRGIIPDFEVWPTFSDFVKNRDTQMEFVKELILHTPQN